MEPGEHWRGVYQAKRSDKLSWYQPLPEPSLEALGRLGVGPEASLIDVGGGTSALAGELAARGWRDLTVLDIAASVVAATSDDLGSAEKSVRWIDADILAWRPDRSFDVWHDRALFHFLVEADDRARYVAALRAGTHAGSLAIVAAFGFDGPGSCSGLPVRRYDAAMIAAELGPEFTPVEAWRQAHVTPWGATQNFQWSAFSRK